MPIQNMKQLLETSDREKSKEGGYDFERFEDFPDGFYPDVEEDVDLSLWPLVAAADSGDLMSVRNLFEKGADKNEATDRKRTAMWCLERSFGDRTTALRARCKRA